MKTFSSLSALYNSLSLNASPTSGDTSTLLSNVTIGKQLINDQHRYLLQKYFDNERTVTITTVGAQNLTVTATLAINAVSATLTASWTYPTCQQYVTFSNGQQRYTLFTKNSTAITWADGLTATATTAIATVGVQDYTIPANISKITNDTINVGQIKFSPAPVMSRADWDSLNTIPYTSDIPNYYFIYNGKLSLFPIPSTTGNIITFNYKTRVPDLTYTDATDGHIANGGMVVGSTSVTGTGTAWITTDAFPAVNIDIAYQNLCLRADPPFGDGTWYPIQSFQSGTALTLVNPVISAPNITASTTYTIGQIPLLSEDFHDMLVYGALMVYYSSTNPNPNQFKQFEALYNARLELLEEYAGTKQVNVDLGTTPNQRNANLFLYANS